jgi:hypothetical protein
MTAILTVHRPPMTVATTAALAQQQPPPLAAMRTPVSHQSDAPLLPAMTDSCAMLLAAPRRTTARYSLACKGAVLGIPPPADRVRGTHQSLLLGLARARGVLKEKSLRRSLYRGSLATYIQYTLILRRLCRGCCCGIHGDLQR